MDDLLLSEAFQRYANDYYTYFEEENSGKVPTNKVIDLIKSGNVPEDVLNQVRNNTFNKFYIFPFFSTKQTFSFRLSKYVRIVTYIT